MHLLGTALAGERLEHAMRSFALGGVATGVAHDVRNLLNAMTLRIALLEGTLAESPEASAAAAAHLGPLRDQVRRVDEVLRRLLAVAEPAAPFGYTDLGALLVDVATLFGHEGRYRHMTISVDAEPGMARTPADPARTGRLVLGLFARALAETPDGGRLAARAAEAGGSAVIAIEHGAGDPHPDLGYYSEVAGAAAAALGGELVEERGEGGVRLSLALPRFERE